MYNGLLKNKHSHKSIRSLWYKLIQTKTQINIQAKILLYFNDLKQTNKNLRDYFSFLFQCLKLQYWTKKNSELDYSCLAFLFNLNDFKLEKYFRFCSVAKHQKQNVTAILLINNFVRKYVPYISVSPT